MRSYRRLRLFLGINKKIHTEIDIILMTFMNIHIHSNAETSKSHHTGHKREILKYDTFQGKRKPRNYYLLLFVSFVNESSFSFVCWSTFTFEENFLTTGVTIINLNVSRNCLEDKVRNKIAGSSLHKKVVFSYLDMPQQMAKLRG